MVLHLVMAMIARLDGDGFSVVRVLVHVDGNIGYGVEEIIGDRTSG
jgi:hypothetical protein